MKFESIKELFENKNVCLIGPATNLIGTNEGENIDKYDLVCRVNSSYIIDDKLKKDYGSKVDVLFSASNFTVSEAVKNNLKYLKDCKVIINPNDKNINGTFASDIINKATKKSIPFYQVDSNFYDKNKGNNTGISSILFILTLNPKKLYIAGFDFYKASDNYEENYIFDHEKEYRNEPRNLPVVKKKFLIKGNIKNSYWNKYQNKIISFFKNNFLNNEKIILHENILKILS